jgi:hypothetical protein
MHPIGPIPALDSNQIMSSGAILHMAFLVVVIPPLDCIPMHAVIDHQVHHQTNPMQYS